MKALFLLPIVLVLACGGPLQQRKPPAGCKKYDCSDLFEGMRPLDPSGDEDRDGIRNEVDKAPTLPEDKDGVQDEDGVPDPDTPEAKAFKEALAGASKKFSDVDKDGIADAYDLCYDGAEDRDGFEDEDGCPDTDNDQDGTPDDKDPCPNVPGTWCSREKSAHSPSAPTPQETTTAGGGTLNIEDEIAFPAKSAKINMQKSRAALNNVLSELMAEPNLKVEIRGFAESTGNADAEKKLSQLRADAVRSELVKLGIDGKRLVAVGVGADIKRVEFVIIP